MLGPRTLLRLAIQAVKAWSNDYAPSMGAAISYYTVFSLAPLLVIVIAVAGGVFGRPFRSRGSILRAARPLGLFTRLARHLHRRNKREPNDEAAALRPRPVNPHLALVGARDLPRDRQTEARARHVLSSLSHAL